MKRERLLALIGSTILKALFLRCSETGLVAHPGLK